MRVGPYVRVTLSLSLYQVLNLKEASYLVPFCSYSLPSKNDWGLLLFRDRTCRHLAARGYYCVTMDSRGHGESDWDPHAKYSSLYRVLDLKASLLQLGMLCAVFVTAICC